MHEFLNKTGRKTEKNDSITKAKTNIYLYLFRILFIRDKIL